MNQLKTCANRVSTLPSRADVNPHVHDIVVVLHDLPQAGKLVFFLDPSSFLQQSDHISNNILVDPTLLTCTTHITDVHIYTTETRATNKDQIKFMIFSINQHIEMIKQMGTSPDGRMG
jgi:hypothetical protein